MNKKYLLSFILFLGLVGSSYVSYFVTPLFNPFIWYLIWGAIIITFFFYSLLMFWGGCISRE